MSDYSRANQPPDMWRHNCCAIRTHPDMNGPTKLLGESARRLSMSICRACKIRCMFRMNPLGHAPHVAPIFDDVDEDVPMLNVNTRLGDEFGRIQNNEEN